MSLTIIELNDSEIRTFKDSEIISREPGYAVLKPEKIETGIEAWRTARTNPRETHNRYWSQLSEDSLIVPSQLARHNADLAYAQLISIHKQVGEPEEIFFIVPGHFSRVQLSLLLGIIEACPFSAAGLIDSAIASTFAVSDAGHYSHVDIHLHYTIITTINITDQITRESVKIVDTVGISKIYDTCAEYLSNLFIDQARFDPLHHAETEQKLYNQIPACLSTLKTSNESTLEIFYENNRYQVKVSTNTLLKKMNQHYEKIYSELAGSAINLISDRLNILPGFAEGINYCTPITEESVFTGCQINIKDVRCTGPNLNLITALPIAKDPIKLTKNLHKISNTTNHKIRQSGLPTHILVNNQAYPVTKQRLYISANNGTPNLNAEGADISFVYQNRTAEVRSENNCTLYVNNNQVSDSSVVNTGDTISFAKSEMIIKCIEAISD